MELRFHLPKKMVELISGPCGRHAFCCWERGMEVLFWVVVLVWFAGAVACLVPFSRQGLWPVLLMLPTAALWPLWLIERWVEGRHYGGS